MQEFQLFWGDMHTHLVDLDRGDDILSQAKANIDFTVVLLYPFKYEYPNGFRVETTGNRPEFLDEWRRINELSKQHYDVGRFTTFPGYEWNGNRTNYGDHNVVYLRENEQLNDTWTLPSLYESLRTKQALAIPHHTGYQLGSRGKDWQFFDSTISPVMEIYSQHGSSEGVGTPEFMAYNTSMGPGTSGGTFRDALERGLRLGVIGSNDGAGLPGRWGMGRAAVWAKQNDRESIWESILARRTYAVTGDRIELDMWIGDTHMGGEINRPGPVDVAVKALGSQTIDKIELIHNGNVIAKYAHVSRQRDGQGFPKRVKIFVEAGWGPASHNGFDLPEEGWSWQGSTNIERGRIISIEKCFNALGQEVMLEENNSSRWKLQTAPRTSRHPFGLRQGMIFELEVGDESIFDLIVEGQHIRLPIKIGLSRTTLLPLVSEIQALTQEQFKLSSSEVTNPDAYYQNARKLVIHRAVPDWEYRASHIFPSIEPLPGLNYFYTRVTQANGQMAWSSPIWLDNQKG